MENSQKHINETIINYRWLVNNIAYKYKSFGISIEDLVSEGTIGLIKAVHKFDASKECSIKTYASIWIKSYIMQYIINNWSLVKIGTNNSDRNLFLKEASKFKQDASLNASSNESGQEFIDLLASNDNIEANFLEKERKNIAFSLIKQTLSASDARARDIFINRRLKSEPKTLEILSQHHEISKERVRQIENKTLNEIKLLAM